MIFWEAAGKEFYYPQEGDVITMNIFKRVFVFAILMLFRLMIGETFITMDSRGHKMCQILTNWKRAFKGIIFHYGLLMENTMTRAKANGHGNVLPFSLLAKMSSLRQ